MRAWIDRAGPYRVERIECPHPDLRVDLSRPRAGTMHTTEGLWESALGVFRVHFAPHFLVGPGRIAQLVPLGYAAAALQNAAGGVETNAWTVAQIEVAGRSQTIPYSFPLTTSSALASLLATLEVEAEIPLSRPFPDAMPPPPWATPTFVRRRMGKWGTTAGWFGHVEVPENAHWDPGALEWGKLLAAAGELGAGENANRLAVLRHWVIARLAEGWTWTRIKASANWAEYRRRGGE